MGLTRGRTVPRVHVFVVEAPGARTVRMHAEAAMARAGHVPASAPAEADALLVCGSPGPDLAAAIDRVWAQVPCPRSRRVATSVHDVDEVIARLAILADDEGPGQAPAAGDAGMDAHGDGRMHGGMAMGAHAYHGMQADTHAGMGGDAHDGMDEDMRMDMPDGSGGDMHAGMDMHAGSDMMHMHMQMAGPGGYPLARGADDRDGLRLDALHRSLGPVLPGWPAGLIVHVTLAGDVVTEARVELLDGATPGLGRDDADARSIVRCDGLARLLEVAGWRSTANRMLRVRDLLLAGDRDRAGATFAPLARRVGRSWLLRWSLRGLEAEPGVSVHARLLGWLDDVRADLVGGASPPPEPATVAGLAESITGHELSSARLIVAARDLALTAPDERHGDDGRAHQG